MYLKCHVRNKDGKEHRLVEKPRRPLQPCRGYFFVLSPLA